MKKQLLAFGLMVAAVTVNAQSTRLSLYEEFTGETCPPCAATNPGLNTLLANPTNTPLIVAIKWQVPIPSAPTNTWSLYQTNKTEIDWRWKTVAAGGYGYSPAINSAPSSKIDGQEATVFGASSGHPANLNNNVIATAQSYTTPFSISMTRAWDATFSTITVTVNIAASSAFTAVGSLKFRLVMIERRIKFATQPGTNGEKDFDDVAVKSFPTLQAGTPMASTWAAAQTQSFVVTCPLPSYIRDKSEVAFVGFIQDDGPTGNTKVWQAGLAEKTGLANDAMAISATVPNLVCASSIAPSIVIGNHGINAITAMTVTPYIDGVAQTPMNITTNLAVGASTTIGLSSINVTGGAHTFSFTITAVSGGDFNTANNSKDVKFVVVQSYQGAAVQEGFVQTFPPANWSTYNTTNGPTWFKVTTCGGFQLSSECTKMDFFNYSAGTVNELNMPPMNLLGGFTPTLTFDVAYATYLTEADKLEVKASTDCGANWTTVYTKAGSALQTSPPQQTAFTPNAASQWRKETVSMTGFNNASVLVKFVATSAYGNNLYVDNVNLQQSSPVGIQNVSSNNIGIEMYPNPASSELNLNISSLNASDATVTITNMLGQVVYSNKTSLEIGNNNLNIDVKNFANGIYNVNIDSQEGSAVKKLTISK